MDRDNNKLRSMILRHEGLKLKPYEDTKGKLTIGVGRNLEDVGISEEEAMQLLENDINERLRQISIALFWFEKLDPVRQDVIVDMVFNLGLSKFLDFSKTIKAIREGDFKTASEEMLLSDWASEVHERALELSLMMATGKYLK